MVNPLVLTLGAGLLACGATAQSLFTELQKERFPVSGNAAVAAGDVDGDGDVDVIAGVWLQPAVLLLNDGTGRFAAAPNGSMPLASSAPTDIALVDVDGDGDLDAVLANDYLSDALLLNDGTGRFRVAPPASFPTDQDRTNGVTPVDVDGDGDTDLVFALSTEVSGRGSPNRLYLNDGAGRFTVAPAGQLPASPEPTRRVLAGDVDGDGDQDLFNLNGPRPSSGPAVPSTLYLNDGSGQFVDSSAAMLPAAGIFGTDAQLGDVDGDGDLDLWVAADQGQGDADVVFVNDGSGHFALALGHIAAVPHGRSRVALGDLDGDGDLDAYAADELDDRLLINSGGGFFAPAASSRKPGAQEPRWSLALVDVDGDGDLDALSGAMRGARLALNDGLGGFVGAAGSSFPFDDDESLSLAAGDLDGDGDADLVVGYGYGARILWQEATGLFRADTSQVFSRDRYLAAAVSDVDRDGDLDLVLARFGNRLQLWDNDGRGHFTEVGGSAFPVSVQLAYGVAAVGVGDVDGDGAPDLVLGQGAPRPNMLLLNRGNGTFLDATPSAMPVDQDNSLSVALGDVDGDGDLDVVFGNGEFRAEQNKLYVNSNGVFTDATATALPALADPTGGVALADVDGDGRLDLVVANVGAQNRLYVNTGGGRFTDATAAQMPADNDATHAVAVGDVDGDGEAELVFAQDGTAPVATLYDRAGGVFVAVPGAIEPVGLVRSVLLADLDRDGDLDLVQARSRTQDRVLWNLSQHLHTPDVAQLGTGFRLQISGTGRAPLGALPIVGVAAAPAPISLPPFGVFELDPAGSVVLPGVAFPAVGPATVPLTLPPVSALAGLRLRAQALVVRALVTESRLTRATADRVIR